MNKLKKFYNEGTEVVKIDHLSIKESPNWNKLDKYEVTETIRLGSGVYWIRAKDIRNQDLIIESQVGGHGIRDKKGYVQWQLECAHQRLMNTLAEE